MRRANDVSIHSHGTTAGKNDGQSVSLCFVGNQCYCQSVSSLRKEPNNIICRICVMFQPYREYPNIFVTSSEIPPFWTAHHPNTKQPRCCCTLIRNVRNILGMKDILVGSVRSSRSCGLLKCHRPAGYGHVMAKFCWFTRHQCSARVIHATEHKSTTADGILTNEPQHPYRILFRNHQDLEPAAKVGIL